MSEQPKQSKDIQLSLVWEDSTDLPTIYANQAFVTHAGRNEFYLVFGEVQVPLFAFRSPEEIQELGSIPIKPVAKLALTPEALIAIVETLQTNVDKYLEKLERKEKDS